MPQIDKNEEDCPPATQRFKLGRQNGVWPPEIKCRIETIADDVQYASPLTFYYRVLIFCIYKGIVAAIIWLLPFFLLTGLVILLQSFSLQAMVLSIGQYVVIAMVIGVIHGLICGITASFLSRNQYRNIKKLYKLQEKLHTWIPGILLMLWLVSVLMVFFIKTDIAAVLILLFFPGICNTY